MRIWREQNRMFVDIHGLRVQEAERRLLDLIASCDRQTTDIVVIHGFRQGQALQEMVRALHAPRLDRARPDYFNEGQTILTLKKIRR